VDVQGRLTKFPIILVVPDQVPLNLLIELNNARGGEGGGSGGGRARARRAFLLLQQTSASGDRAAEVGMPLFTTALGLYGGVLWSGEHELQGFVIHEMVPPPGRLRAALCPCRNEPARSSVQHTRLLAFSADPKVL
jgi:hypothetical protein